MVISLASRSASRMISSKDLRRISARSRGFLPAQPSKAALAASTAALASSTVALATEAILFSVAGSRTSKRPPSEDLRHLPPIHRSVGTLARRLSYLELMGVASWLAVRRARASSTQLPRNRCAPLPLVGRGWGWGSRDSFAGDAIELPPHHPPPHPSPTRGEGAHRV